MKKTVKLKDTFIGTLAKLSSKRIGKKQPLNDIQLPGKTMSNALAQSDSNQMPWTWTKEEKRNDLVPSFILGGTDPSD